MNIEPARTPGTGRRFITDDRMVTNILVVTALGLLVIAAAVGMAGDNPAVVWILTTASVLDLGVIILTVRGYSLPGRILLPVILTAAAAYIAYNRGGLYHISMLGFPVIVVLSGLLLGARGAFIFAAIGSLGAVFIGYADINGLSPFSASSRTGYDDIAVAVTMLMLTAVVLRVIIQRLTESILQAEEYGKAQEQANAELKNLQGELEKRVETRTRELKSRSDQLEAIAAIARSVANIQEMRELLSRIARLVSERFGFYHVGIILLDENHEYALLQASNSEGGEKMLARGHRLRVGQQGIVGYVTSRGAARIALDVGAEAVFFNNPDLPETHSEVALPLKLGQEIIGALDIQSRKTNAFTLEDVEIFTILADQVAVAIQNARSLERAQRALREVEIASAQLTGRDWKEYVETIRTRGYRYDGIKPEPLKKTAKNAAEDKGFTVPVRLRGQTIGRINLRATESSRNWTDDELAIIESTAERVALAIDGARLLDDAQKRAARETFLSQLAARLGASFKLDSILRDTVEELGETLKGSTVTFQLVNPASPPAMEGRKDPTRREKGGGE
jgi:GAF domain-containing protein